MVKPYQSKLRFSENQSPVIDISEGSIQLEIDPSFVHSFAGVVFFNDPDGITPVQPSAGTTTFTVRAVVQSHAMQSVPNNVLNANAPDQVDWAVNADLVRATFTGVTGATHARLIVAGNSS